MNAFIASIPKGSKLLAPGRCFSSAPGVSSQLKFLIPKGSQTIAVVTGCDPSGIGVSIFAFSPGALLRSDPGLMAVIPPGSIENRVRQAFMAFDV